MIHYHFPFIALQNLNQVLQNIPLRNAATKIDIRTKTGTAIKKLVTAV